MAELDNLSIKLQGDSTNASKAIGEVIEALGNLQSKLDSTSNRTFNEKMTAAGTSLSSLQAAVNGVNTNGIDKIAGWLTNLSTALKDFDVAKFNSVNEALSTLMTFKASELPSFKDVGAGLGLLGEGADQSADIIEKISTGVKTLSDVTVPEGLADKLAGLADSLTKFSNIKPPDPKELAGLGELFETLQKSMPKVEVGKITNAWANLLEHISKINLAGMGENIRSAIDALNGFSGVQVPSFDGFDTLAGGLTNIRNALQDFPSTVDKAISAAGNLNRIKIPNSFQSSMSNITKGLEAFNSMTTVMQGAAAIGTSFSEMADKFDNGSDKFKQAVDALEKLAAVNIPTEIPLALIDIRKALVELQNDVDPNKIGSIKNQMQALGSTGKAVQNAAQNMKKASKGKNGFVDSFMDGADAMGFMNGASIQLGTQLGSITSVVDFTTDMFKRLTNTVTNLPALFTNSSRSTNVLRSSLQKVYYTLGAIRRIAYAVRAAFNAIKVPIDLASDLTEVQNVVLQAFGPQNFQTIDNWSKGLVTAFGVSSKTAKEAAARYGAMAVSMGMSQKQATEMAQTMVERAADIGSLYNKDFETVAKNMDSVFTGMVAPMRKYGVDLTQASLKEYALANGMDANIKGMSQMQKAMLRYQYVLEKTSIAQGDFARTSDTWANQVKILKTYLEALGSTIGQVFINMLKPAVRAINNMMNAIIGLVERTVNAIGKMMGWQIEIAPTFADTEELQEDLAEAADDTAAGMDKANDSAKKLKKTILSFDELHVLQKPDEGSKKSGSGSGGGDAGGADAAENIVKGGEMLLKRYESDIKDWFDLGSRIGNTLTEALESIDWNKVYQGARGFGTNLASFLNGLITPRLFNGVGMTIASALNTALHYLDSFGMTFNWKNFGTSIAAGINGFFSTFDFGLLAHTVNVWAKGILDTIIEGLQQTDWKQIVRGFNDFIGGLYFTGAFKKLGASIRDALIDVMRTIDWATIYKQASRFGIDLANFLNSLLTPQLFVEVGRTLAGVLNTAFGYINSFWDTFDWHGFGVSLGRGIKRFFAEFDVYQFTDVLLKWTQSFLTVLWTTLTTAGVDSIAKAMGYIITTVGAHKAISLAFTQLGSTLSVLFKNAIITAVNPSNWADAFDAITALSFKFGSAFASAFSGNGWIASFSTAFGGVAKGILALASVITGILTGIGIAVTNFLEMWNSGWSLAGEVLKDIGIAIVGVAAVIGGFVTGPIALLVGAIVAAVSGIAIAVHDKIAGNAKQDFLDFIQASEGAGHTMDDFAAATKDAVDSVTKDLDGMNEHFKHLSSVREEIGQTITKITGISTAMATTGTATQSEVDDLMTSFSNLQSSLQDYIDSYYDAIVQQMVIDMQYLDSQGKLTDEMKDEYAKRITETYKAKDAAKESADEVIANFQSASQDVSDMAEQYGWDSKEVQDATKRSMDAALDLTSVAQKYTGTMNDELSPAIDNTKQELDKLAGGLDLSKEGMSSAKDLTHKYTDTVRDMQTQVNDAKEKIHEYYQNLRDNLSETATSQEEYDWLMEQYNQNEQTRIQDIETKYGELKTQLDNEVRPAFDTMHVTMSDDLDQMDRDADSKLSKLFSTFGRWIQNIKDKWNEMRGMKIDAEANLSGTVTTTPALPVQRFAGGGIIEDGLFTMSHGEIAGRFSNGQSVVANNEQIQQGIRDAVVDGMMEVYMATASDNASSSGDLVLVVGDEEIARASMRGQKKIDKRFNPTIAFSG